MTELFRGAMVDLCWAIQLRVESLKHYDNGQLEAASRLDRLANDAYTRLAPPAAAEFLERIQRTWSLEPEA